MAIIKRNNQQNDNRLTRYSPMFSLFDDFMRNSIWDDFNDSMRNISSDMWEENDSVFVKMALPGIDPENVDISVTGDTLTIKGEVKEESEDKDNKRNYYQKQLSYGSLMQTFTLPTLVDSNKAEATFDKGMLTVKLPKSEESKPKQIKVNVHHK